MKFGDYIMTKFSKEQRGNLQHFIVNVLTNPATARLLKRFKSVDEGDVTISKEDAEIILSNLGRIRKFVLELPKEEE